MDKTSKRGAFSDKTLNRFHKRSDKSASDKRRPFNQDSRPKRVNDRQKVKVFSKEGVSEIRVPRDSFDKKDSFKDRDLRHDKDFKDSRFDKESFKKSSKDFLMTDEELYNLDENQRRVGFSPFQLRLVQSILTETLTEGKPLDKAYAIYFAKVKLEPVEQGFIIRQINAMFRRLSFYAYVAGLKRPSDLARHINRLIVVYCADKKFNIPNLDCEGFDRRGMFKRLNEGREDILLNEGCPIWLEELASKELKDRWPSERKALCEEARRYIRANTLKCTKDELAKRLSNEGVVTKSVKGSPLCLEVTSNSALFRTKAFKDGLFEQQDAGSQLIAPFLEAKASMRVVDTCAGAGGKTLHIAATMEGKGSIIALDTESWKLDELKKRAKRAGAFNIETRHIDSTKVIKRLYDMADRVLIDAPCSGIGVLRRTPDSKWRDMRASLIELRQIQADIVERYSRIAKVGGIVVYATCSILPSENREQIDAFLEKHKDSFELIEDKSLMPSEGFDGFYMAKLKRIA